MFPSRKVSKITFFVHHSIKNNNLYAFIYLLLGFDISICLFVCYSSARLFVSMHLNQCVYNLGPKKLMGGNFLGHFSLAAHFEPDSMYATR